MENKAHALSAGTFVLVVCALLVGLAVWLTRETGVQWLFEVSSAESVTGLQPQAPIFGNAPAKPGPGELGFVAPAERTP